MDSFWKISLHSSLWIAAALIICTWSIAPAPANAGGVIGSGIPALYAQYSYYPYAPGYYCDDKGVHRFAGPEAETIRQGEG